MEVCPNPQVPSSAVTLHQGESHLGSHRPRFGLTAANLDMGLATSASCAHEFLRGGVGVWLGGGIVTLTADISVIFMRTPSI